MQFLRNKLGFFIGIFVFLFLLAVPLGIETIIQRTLAIVLLCAIWWISEAIPIPATALLPGFLLPVFGILPIDTAFGQYANKVIFLFLGGFLIAQAMIKWKLDKRIALHVLKRSGTNPATILFAFMLITAFLSAFISNTATVAMMLPIGMAILLRVNVSKDSEFGKVLMLGIAYSATIGGISTLIGTPPNVVMAGFMDTLLGQTMSFFEWLKIGLPFSAIMLPLTWRYLLWRHKPEIKKVQSSKFVHEEIKKLGPMSRGEKNALFVFILVATLWISHPFWHYIPIHGIVALEATVHDSMIAMIAAMLLFIIPVNFRKWQPTLSWRDAQKISWGVLILFGGGLALGKGMFESGTAHWIASHLSGIQALPVLGMILVIGILCTFLTEVTSNTATTGMILPILIAMATSFNINPLLLIFPATLACSNAFMLPIATPPNAIAYGSGYIKMQDMIRTGFLLNLIGLVVLTFTIYFISGGVFGLF